MISTFVRRLLSKIEASPLGGGFKRALVAGHNSFLKALKGAEDAWLGIRFRVAQRLSLPDAKAYAFKAMKCFTEMKRLESQDLADWDEVHEWGEDSLRYFHKSLDADGDQFLLWHHIAKIHRFLGNNTECHAAEKAYIDEKRRVSERNQSARLKICFINKKPLMATIGNIGYLDGYLKAKIVEGRTDETTLLLLNPGERAEFANPHIIKYFEKYVTLINNPQLVKSLKPYENELLVHLGGPFEYNGGVYVTHSTMSQSQQRWIDEGRAPLCTLDDEDLAKGRELLDEMGVPEDAWHVCLHVREGKGAKGNEPFRQANIETYLSAIEAVVERGGWVIRMGDPSMTPLPDMKNVVDYAHSKFKSAWADVFLCGAARFFIGTSSGLCTFAMTFGVPIVQTNYLPLNTLSFTSQDIFLPKLCRRKGSDEFVPFSELFSHPLNGGGNQGYYDRLMNVDVIDNTPDELRGAVVEMMDILDGAQTYSDEEKALQDSFLAMTAECETLPGLKGRPINCRIGQEFLNQHSGLMGSPNTLEG